MEGETNAIKDAVDTVLLSSGKIVDVLTYKVNKTATDVITANNRSLTAALTRQLKQDVNKFNAVLDNLSIELQKSEFVLGLLDASLKRKSNIESFFDPNGIAGDKEVANNDESKDAKGLDETNDDFLMGLNLDGFGTGTDASDLVFDDQLMDSIDNLGKKDKEEREPLKKPVKEEVVRVHNRQPVTNDNIDFVDLDGIDMGGNLDGLDLNLLNLPEGSANDNQNEDVDMDKLYDLIGLN